MCGNTNIFDYGLGDKPLQHSGLYFSELEMSLIFLQPIL